jgi:hypothetical protein
MIKPAIAVLFFKSVGADAHIVLVIDYEIVAGWAISDRRTKKHQANKTIPAGLECRLFMSPPFLKGRKSPRRPLSVIRWGLPFRFIPYTAGQEEYSECPPPPDLLPPREEEIDLSRLISFF